MRLIILLLSAFFFATCNTTLDNNSGAGKHGLSYIDNIKQNIWVIPANKSYVEPYKDINPGITHNQAGSDNNNQIDVTDWVSQDVSLCWYLNFNSGIYSINLEAEVELNNFSEFMLSVSGIDNPEFQINKRISLKGINEFILYPNLLNIDIPQKGFYKIKLSPILKSGKEYASLRNIVFVSDKDTRIQSVRYANWLSSPNVYLTCELPDQIKCDWLHSEILIPKGCDPAYTFYMGLGFYRGYFGVQVISQTERRILFSVWDSSNEPVKRALVKKEDQVTLVRKGKDVVTQGFENQGTGGQSYLIYPWVTDVPIELLVNRTLAENNSVIFSAWFKQKVSEDNKWIFIASWRAPHDNRTFTNFYSYIDNFSGVTGDVWRKAYFYNYWGRNENTKNWVEFNEMKVQHTDGDKDSRSDFGSGVDDLYPNRFYIWSGGYKSPKVQDMVNSVKTDVMPVNDFDSLQTEVDMIINRYNK